MAKTTRVELNRQALAEVTLAVADGALAVVERVVEVAVPPDAPPIGQGLIATGGTLLYVNGRKVGGSATKKPRSVNSRKAGIVAVAGWSNPARFNEFGTIHQPARPFASPAWAQVQPQVNEIMSAATKGKLGGLKP
jgi:hypothetical protein